jgi:hypothetical protein
VYWYNLASTYLGYVNLLAGSNNTYYATIYDPEDPEIAYELVMSLSFLFELGEFLDPSDHAVPTQADIDEFLEWEFGIVFESTKKRLTALKKALDDYGPYRAKLELLEPGEPGWLPSVFRYKTTIECFEE